MLKTDDFYHTTAIYQKSKTNSRSKIYSNLNTYLKKVLTVIWKELKKGLQS